MTLVRPTPRRTGVPGLAVLLTLLTASAASAHLCLIRQGNESQGNRETGDEFGSAVIAGDFNGDGYEDLATGSRGEDVNGASNAGAVIINWGSEFGLTHVGAQLILRDTAGGGTPASGDEFGFALAAGNFNGDAYDDLVIGAPGVDGSGANAAGEVYVMRGSASGLVVWHALNQSLLGGANETNDRFGEALSVGLLNGDGIPDLVIGGPGEDNSAGAVFWRMGSSIGLFGASGWAKQSTYGGTDTAGDRFGASLDIGNLTWDANAEIAVGAPGKNWSGVTDSGIVLIIAGSGAGPTPLGTFVLTAADVGNLTVSGAFGTAVSIGWFMNAQGYYSLAVGEPGYDFNGIDASGRVVVLPGSAAGFNIVNARYLDKLDVGGVSPRVSERFGYTLASGFFGASDGYHDLAIGTPYDDISGTVADAGYVYVSYGSANGPGTNGWARFNQGNLNDYLDVGAHLGWSLCYGEFDATGNGNLVAGAPGNFGSTGMVHVIAPWRQTYGLNCRSSVAYDCDHNLIFSQKAFDQLSIASTTKVMTILLACERAQLPPNDPDYVALDTVYDVPGWCVSDVPGSQVPLLPGEEMTFENLMYTCLMLSGNDAAYAIAHLLGGNSPVAPSVSVAAFVADMNAKAAALGMTNTSFHNPAGLDSEVTFSLGGSHHSSAEDMATLSRAAMQNPLFRQISETVSRTITRSIHLPFLDAEYDWTFSNFMSWIVNSNSFPEGIGIKGGWTPNAEITGVYAAKGTFGQFAVAGTFYSPQELPQDQRRQDAIDLLELSLAECNVVPGGWQDFLFSHYFDGISTFEDAIRGFTFPQDGSDLESVLIDLIREDLDPASTSAHVEVTHLTTVGLDPNGSETFGIAPFEGHDDIVISNPSDSPIGIRVFDTVDPTPVIVALDPGESYIVPAFYGGPDALYTLTVENILPDFGVSFGVEARYVYDATFPGGTGRGAGFSVAIPRGDTYTEDVFDVRVTGADPMPGHTLAVYAHDPAAPVAVDDADTPHATSSTPLVLQRVSPSPFATSATLAFDVVSAGEIEVELFTVGGRRVRHLVREAYGAGPVEVRWDGRNDEGRDVANGVYFYRVSFQGVTAGVGNIVRVR